MTYGFFLLLFLADSPCAQEQAAPKANPLTAQASAKLAAGDREGACRDALQASLQDPSDENALALARLSCEKIQTNLKFQGLKVQRHEIAPEKKEPPPRREPQGGATAVSIPPPPSGPKAVAPTSYDKTVQAQDAFQRGRYAEAAQAATAAVALDPRNLRAYVLLAGAYQASGQPARALEAAQAGLGVNAQNLSLLKSKALAQVGLGDWKGALESAEAAVKSNATDPMAHVLRAFALGRLGRRDEMFSALRTASALEPAYEKLYIEAQNSKEGSAPFLLPGQAEAKASLSAPRAGAPRNRLRDKFLFMGLLAALAVVAVLLAHSLLVYWTRRPNP